MATASGSSCSAAAFDSDKAIRELKEKGYTVVPNVMSHAKCDELIQKYMSWVRLFNDEDTEPKSRNSVIQSYRVSHLHPTWEARLATKKVFAQIWGTEKLLTSTDAIAISKPPEEDSGEFAMEGQDWLHLDQSVKRDGLHAYQGGLYLEETTESDHCFRVLSHSHNYHSTFYQTFPKAADKSRRLEFYKLTKTQKDWYNKRGCVRTKIPVPKGGMVLWDSRTVHDNCRPLYGREHTDRWRFVVFVSMTPAKWATAEDLEKKKEIYENLFISSHWSSQGLKFFKAYNPKKKDRHKTLSVLPYNARTLEAKQLSGVVPYNFGDGQPSGPDAPVWIP